MSTLWTESGANDTNPNGNSSDNASSSYRPADISEETKVGLGLGAVVGLLLPVVLMMTFIIHGRWERQMRESHERDVETG